MPTFGQIWSHWQPLIPFPVVVNRLTVLANRFARSRASFIFSTCITLNHDGLPTYQGCEGVRGWVRRAGVLVDETPAQAGWRKNGNLYQSSVFKVTDCSTVHSPLLFSVIEGEQRPAYLKPNRIVNSKDLWAQQKNPSYIGEYIDWLWSSEWPDWVIFCTLGNLLKPLATINLPKSLTFLGNFCKGVKMYDFSSEIIFGQLL